MSNWVKITNPYSPLKGKRGRLLGKHSEDYIEIFLPSEGKPFIIKEEEVSPCLVKER